MEENQSRAVAKAGPAKKPLTAAQIRKKTITRRARLRALIQLIFFVSMPGAFVAGFSGVKHIFQWIGKGEVLEIDSFVLVFLALCGFTLLFGRFFCGFVCAFGSLGDAVNALSVLFQKKVLKRKKPFRFPEGLLRTLQKVKYLVLAAIVILCGLNLYDKTAGYSPWDVFSQLTALRLPSGAILAGIILFILILAGMALQPRFFCQCLCPLGAVFALLPAFPFSQLERKEERCIKGCNACKNQCPVGIKLEHDGMRNGECIACEACVSACPRFPQSNISRWDLKLTGGKAFISVCLKAAVFFLMGCGLGLCRFL